MILDGQLLTRQLYGEALDPREHLVRMYPQAAPAVPPLSHVVATAAPMVARVNHGLWIASCECGAPREKLPTPGCVVFLDVPLGFCVRCGNRAWGGGWRRIAVPDHETRARIEAVLDARPNVEDRNWEPSETVDDLVAQNREHGDPVPDLRLTTVGPILGPDWRRFVAPFAPLPRAATRAGRRFLRKLTGRR